MYEHSKYCPCKGQEVSAKAYTVDGIEIVDGLRVFTNNLDLGTVDLTRATWEWHGSEGKHHLWFHVKCDTSYKGEPMDSGYQQSDDRVITRYDGQQA